VALAILCATLNACRQAPDRSEGVELVLSSDTPTPAMKFELRFPSAMVTESAVGVPATNCPLAITPSVAGVFTWLSPRNGVFAPTEPLALGRKYELSLRPGLPCADGQPARAALHHIVVTPAFGLTASSPRQANNNASAEPEVKLLFNATVRAEEVQRYLSFSDNGWQRVAADARQGTAEELDYELGRFGSLRTWAEEFQLATNTNPAAVEREASWGPTNPVANLLIVTPRSPLPLGKGWKLVLGTGLPAADRSLRLRNASEVPVGDITPFVATDAKAANLILSGPSVRLTFSKPVPESLTNRPADWLEITPSPTNLTVHPAWRSLVLRGAFQGETWHTVKLGPDFKSSDGFRLAGSNTFRLKVPRVAPRLYFPALSRDQLAGGRRTFPLLGINVPQVRLRAKLMDPQTAIHALRGYESYTVPWEERRDSPTWEEPYRAIDYNQVPGRTVFDEEVALSAEADTARRLDLSWDRLLAGRRTGVVFLDAERAGDKSARVSALGMQALIQLTDLGFAWKQGRTGFDVFVFSQTGGQAIPGATAKLFSDENEPLQEAVTDASGLAHLPVNTNADWIAVQLGNDFHATAMQGGQSWLCRLDGPLGVPTEEEISRRVMLFSDRNVYRPGEELHLEALVRDWGEQGLTVPAGLTGTLDCIDARDRQFFHTNAAFSPAGACSVSIQLPIGARGPYSAKLHLGTNEYPCGFRVQDFQPNAFEITVPSKSAFGPDERIAFSVSARYLLGKPLSRAQVKWWLRAEDTEFNPEGFDGFSFGRSDYEFRRGRGSLSTALDGKGVLSASSNFVVSPNLPINGAAPKPRLASLVIEVTDLNQQTLSHRIEFLRHSSDFYLGLRQGAEVLPAGQPLQLDIAAVRTDGHPWPDPVQARLILQRIDWVPVRIQGAGRTVRYRNEPIVTNLLEKEITVPPIPMPGGSTGAFPTNRVPGLPALPAGHYLVEAKAQDPGGYAVVSSLDFEVSAPAALGWNYRNGVRLTIKPDRKSYVAGDTALILVEAPFSGTACVSVEREKVLRSVTTRLEGNAPSIRVPLEPGDAPNVFVSVTLVRGSDDCPRKIKEPEYRHGSCELSVVDPGTRLAVTVTPGQTNYLPAQPVEVAVQVTDAGGHPVSGAELVLFAVDDGILHLTGYELPDPHSFFYAARPLAVETSISLPNLLTEDPAELRFENKGYLGGGGGMERVRNNFLACACWNAALTTDAQGHASARFAAPDSLTRYRVFAVAFTANSRFGSGQAAFQVSKPLIIEPALPAFANITDHLVARSLIQNQTASGGDVDVSLELDSRATAREPGQRVTQRVPVPPHGSAVVEFPVQLTDTGTARWIWKARFADPAAGQFADAVQSSLEVGHVVPMLREVLLSHAAVPQTNLLTRANPLLLAGQGTITVNIASTRLNDLGEAAAQLLHYPYGCAEQTGSSLLPWIVLRDSPGLLPLPCRGTNEIAQAIRVGVARLFSMQTKSGGLGYWPRARDPMLWASAYGGMVLALAERHGIELPKEEFASLLAYLQQQLRAAGPADTDLGDLCLGLYALALAGKAEPAYHERLYSRRQQLGAEDKALLALAIAESRGPAQMIGELLRPAPAARRETWAAFGCLAREEAVRLLAWIHYRPDDPLVDEFVSDLMRDQQRAHWGTTQGDAWALLALTEYARRIEGKTQPAEASLKVGDQTVAFRLEGQTNVFTHTVAITNLAGTPLTLFNRTTNCLYTSVLIEARPPANQPPSQDKGFALRRSYERLDDDNRPYDLRDLRVGDRVLVTLKLSAHEAAHYIVIDDALPCILEAVNSAFKTQAPGPASPTTHTDDEWVGTFREIRQDRCLYFADWLAPGDYTVRYVARARAAGTVTAPPAQVEEMYHPERYGLSGTQTVSCQAAP
jgi:uncharacterized protein YfaS (alpha-2-macroglobulin family)